MILTLLLERFLPTNFAVALTTLLIAAVLLALFIPIYLLSRPTSSGRDKLVALGLALLPIWFGDVNSKYGYVFYLPLVFALLSLMRSGFSR
jgi:hypothetical protein